ncbi:Sds3-like-domain-containing protein [Podospora australis]|uniref:Sds3-like-domain-containing protein n=1 Tax=Podospora australis TaxID=1536484 RepID=A0AAN6X2A7_9PEZI|nr:Sds3-like-domain-containing protein [Podospora australis]
MATADSAMGGAPVSTPAQASQSKRDKRRQLIQDRVSQISERMTKDRDTSFREQLHRIQLDANLTMRIDPYADRPFDSFEEDQQKFQPPNGDANKTYLDVAGPRFFKWMEEVQDLVEQRDYTLTKHKNDYDKKVSEYQATHAFKVETADREFKALSQTLRDRLINAISSKKTRLNKEKEALEISDASALLLHPNQFSIANPASPGGPHGKRTTRLRHMEENGADGKKRKRNNNDDDGSPGPQKRAGIEAEKTTPLWQTDRVTNRKATGPIYSIDKLFTDKELSMTYNTAALAAHKYLLTHKPKYDEHGRPIHSPGGSDSGNGDQDDDADSVPSAPMMERNVSHATRSGQRGANNPNFMDDKLMGMEMLANFDFPGNFDRMLSADPKLPATFPTTYVKGHNRLEYNVTSTLADQDANGDLMVMQALKQYDQTHGPGSNLSMENGSRKLLEAASQTARDHRYVAYLQGERPSENEVRKRLGLPVLPDTVEPITSNERSSTPRPGHGGTPGQSPAKGFGGVAMSRQSSANGVPMSRSSSRKGGRGRGG